MKGAFLKLKEKITKPFTKKDEFDLTADDQEKYVEIDTQNEGLSDSKIIVRPFVLNDYDDSKIVINALREGYTIALVNIRPLKEQDLVELKRAINKIKKTTDAVEGDIAGFGDDWIVVTPSFASIHRESPVGPKTSNVDDELH
ncbi:cell division protein SepF [Candidatus Woesearchaeota archaeon]|nr:cell division protein SepF [Candidatus Woesearchaeota archaeon]